MEEPTKKGLTEKEPTEKESSEKEDSEKESSDSWPITNEDIMKKLILIEKLLLEMSQTNVQMKNDTSKMSNHIDTVDAVMAKVPLNWLSFKMLKF